MLNQRLFNRPGQVDPQIYRLENWKPFGSVKQVEFDGRKNVVCLTTKKRAAKITIYPRLQIPKRVSAYIYSPLGNEKFGVGRLIADEEAWEASQGMWKRLEAKIMPGQALVFEATGQNREKAEGDKTYIDLSTLAFSL